MEPILQKCSLPDLPQLVKMSKQTFIEAFEKVNKPDDFEHYIKTAFSETQLGQELQNPNSSFYFVFVDNDLAGYFKLNAKTAQTEYKDHNSVELERIYILLDYQGKRIGAWILQEAFKIAAFEKKEFMWLGVWQKNTRAIRFYEKYGFKKIGTHPYYIGKDKQTDWLMRYDLVNFRRK